MADDAGAGAGAGADMVPRSRLNEVIAERNAARADLGTARSELEQAVARAGVADTLAQQLDAAQQAAATATSQLEVHQTLSRRGIHDPDEVALLQWQHGRAPLPDGTTERPALLPWLYSLQAAPDSAPSTVRGILARLAGAGAGAGVGAGGAGAGGAGAGPRSRDTRPPGGGAGAGGAGAADANADAARLRADAQQSGDWSKFRERFGVKVRR